MGIGTCALTLGAGARETALASGNVIHSFAHSAANEISPIMWNDFMTYAQDGSFVQACIETLQIVCLTLFVGGLFGLFLGVLLWGTRPGSLFENRLFYRVLDICINMIRPIPFIIFLAAAQPVTIAVIGTSIGTAAVIFPMIIMCANASARLVEQNLLSVDAGVIEAARAMGVSRFSIITTILVPEALAPLILSYAFLFISVLDMSAMAGYIGGGGLGNFAIAYGYQKFNPCVTWACVIIMIVLVQIVQISSNAIANHILHKRQHI